MYDLIGADMPLTQEFRGPDDGRAPDQRLGCRWTAAGTGSDQLPTAA
jgi:hypothetical protein